jgi:transcriptional regulator NrdR family protein
MNCPNCGYDDNFVARTVNYSDSVVIRYRRCRICDSSFKTSEIMRKEKKDDKGQGNNPKAIQ